MKDKYKPGTSAEQVCIAEGYHYVEYKIIKEEGKEITVPTCTLYNTQCPHAGQRTPTMLICDGALKETRKFLKPGSIDDTTEVN